MKKKKLPNKDVVINAAHHFHNHEPHHIDEVIFKDNFHLIVTFRNGVIKDIDAFSFINHKWKVRNCKKLIGNVSLFKNPWIVGYDSIDWLEDDFAEIDSDFLWEKGKTIKKAPKRSVFIKLKELPCGFTLTTNTNERSLPRTPHFHVFSGDLQVGVISVNYSRISLLNWLRLALEKDYKKITKYIRKNKTLFTQIYNAKTTAEKKKLAKKLPEM